MVHNKIITWCVALAIGCVSVSPAFAGYQTIYVPDNYSGQTIVYQQPQTVVIRETQPVYVNSGSSAVSDALLLTGAGIVGGVLMHSILGHHHKSYRPAPPRPVFRPVKHRR